MNIDPVLAQRIGLAITALGYRHSLTAASIRRGRTSRIIGERALSSHLAGHTHQAGPPIRVSDGGRECVQLDVEIPTDHPP